ncbi:MAG: hypothetical protein ACREQV_16440 [Candidatus Binatia bacterium]
MPSNQVRLSRNLSGSFAEAGIVKINEPFFIRIIHNIRYINII